jgi:uncharacterized protein Yka (UPF0111/DUF47 family)
MNEMFQKFMTKLDQVILRLDKTEEKVDAITKLQVESLTDKNQNIQDLEQRLEDIEYARAQEQRKKSEEPIVVGSLADTKKPFDSFFRRSPRVKNYVATFEDRFEALKYHAHDPGPVRNIFFWNFLWPPPRVIRIRSIEFNPSRLDSAG